MKLAYKIGLLAGTAILLLLLPARGRTEQMQRFDDYLVHYNALSSDLLPAQVAAQYNIPRSSKQGLLNIAVQKAGAEPVPVAAEIRGTIANLAGQRSDVTVLRGSVDADLHDVQHQSISVTTPNVTVRAGRKIEFQ